ncbi:hypothetical protein B4U79_14977, partial [Dinothrombium tinctorium]
HLKEAMRSFRSNFALLLFDLRNRSERLSIGSKREKSGKQKAEMRKNNVNAENSNRENVWRKMLIPNEKWDDKDQFLDVIYWSRQVLAIVMGFVWGFVGITGFLGIALYMALNSAAVYLYSLRFNSDNENMMEYVKEGFMTSFAAFMVIKAVLKRYETELKFDFVRRSRGRSFIRRYFSD